ncbi:MAG TPA: hypothetical protein ENG63_03090 [Candidatus Desulfofervidus auxilii]|uniref:Uncharacterized protein n=1 Tax=Desulfofervidus auxilii TaxID=1621989 RepID=A0A7C0Y9F4_DESA2|nr:hypothetical protein [Candidatus Desulfofervidus auxilii]
MKIRIRCPICLGRKKVWTWKAKVDKPSDIEDYELDDLVPCERCKGEGKIEIEVNDEILGQAYETISFINDNLELLLDQTKNIMRKLEKYFLMGEK